MFRQGSAITTTIAAAATTLLSPSRAWHAHIDYNPSLAFLSTCRHLNTLERFI